MTVAIRLLDYSLRAGLLMLRPVAVLVPAAVRVRRWVAARW